MALWIRKDRMIGMIGIHAGLVIPLVAAIALMWRGWERMQVDGIGSPQVILLGISGVLGAFCIYGVQLTSRYFAIKMVADLRCEVAKHILSLPLRYFGQRRMGELISNVTNDALLVSKIERM